MIYLCIFFLMLLNGILKVWWIEKKLLFDFQSIYLYFLLIFSHMKKTWLIIIKQNRAYVSALPKKTPWFEKKCNMIFICNKFCINATNISALPCRNVMLSKIKTALALMSWILYWNYEIISIFQQRTEISRWSTRKI